MRAVILAGGKGTRLAPFTAVIPKPLIPVSGMPILEIILRQLRLHGFDDIVLCVGYLPQLISAYFGDGRAFGVKITYVTEETPLGTAGPLALVPQARHPILVMNADVLSSVSYSDLFAHHRDTDAALTISLHTKQVKLDLGVLTVGDSSRIVEYREKPSFEYKVSMGVYVVSPRVHAMIRQSRERVDFPDLVSRLIGAHHSISAYTFNGYWLDIGRPAEYEQACADFERLRDLFFADPRVRVAEESTTPVLGAPAVAAG
jgi:NDP-sugar pyrophosphorylase family protein